MGMTVTAARRRTSIKIDTQVKDPIARLLVTTKRDNQPHRTDVVSPLLLMFCDLVLFVCLFLYCFLSPSPPYLSTSVSQSLTISHYLSLSPPYLSLSLSPYRVRVCLL